MGVVGIGQRSSERYLRKQVAPDSMPIWLKLPCLSPLGRSVKHGQPFGSDGFRDSRWDGSDHATEPGPQRGLIRGSLLDEVAEGLRLLG